MQIPIVFDQKAIGIFVLIFKNNFEKIISDVSYILIPSTTVLMSKIQASKLKENNLVLRNISLSSGVYLYKCRTNNNNNLVSGKIIISVN